MSLDWKTFVQNAAANALPWRSYGDRQNSESVARPAGAVFGPTGASTNGAEPSAGEAGGGAARTGVEIVAWRSWNLGSEGKLQSLSHYFIWNGPVVHADVAPTRANTNGIYAVRTLEQAPPTHVWGQVALSGIVVEGEHGYRAEVATIRSLYVARRWDALAADGYHAGYTFVEWPDAALLAALEERYKVDVVVSESRHGNAVMLLGTSTFNGTMIPPQMNQLFATQQMVVPQMQANTFQGNTLNGLSGLGVAIHQGP